MKGKSIYDLSLFEEVCVTKDGLVSMRRVPGGWVYLEQSYLDEKDMHVLFIPNDDEMIKREKNNELQRKGQAFHQQHPRYIQSPNGL